MIPGGRTGWPAGYRKIVRVNKYNQIEMRLNKRVFGLGAAAAVLSCGVATGQDGAAEKPAAAEPAGNEVALASDDKVMAKVNGKEITKGDLINRIKQRMGPQAASLPEGQIEGLLVQMGKQVTDDLINEMLLDQASKEAKVEIDETDVEQAIERLRRAVPEGEKFGDFLKTMGTTEGLLRQDFERSMRISKFLDGKTEGAEAPSDESVKAFYEAEENARYFEQEESVKARHILVKTEPGLDEAGLAEKKAQIDAIRVRLVGENAEDFATVAKEASEGPSGPQGGDLGEFGRGQMVPEFETAAFAQKVGEVGEPVKTQFGYHLIKVESKSDGAGKVPFDEVSAKITEFLSSKQEQEVVGEFVEGLRKEAKIEYIN